MRQSCVRPFPRGDHATVEDPAGQRVMPCRCETEPVSEPACLYNGGNAYASADSSPHAPVCSAAFRASGRKSCQYEGYAPPQRDGHRGSAPSRSRCGIRHPGHGQPQRCGLLPLHRAVRARHGQHGQAVVQAHRQYPAAGRAGRVQTRQAVLDTERLHRDPRAQPQRSGAGRERVFPRPRLCAEAPACGSAIPAYSEEKLCFFPQERDEADRLLPAGEEYLLFNVLKGQRTCVGLWKAVDEERIRFAGSVPVEIFAGTDFGADRQKVDTWLKQKLIP